MNFLTMQQEVASSSRLDITNTSLLTLIKRWINMSGKEIWAETEWNWALDRQIVQTVVDKTAGTVSINSGAAAVTGVSTAFASTDIGSYIQFSTSNDWYKITGFTSSTAITIESNYVASTNLSGGTYIIRKFFYSLGSNVEKILTARQAISPGYISVMHYRDFDIFRPNPTATGNPLAMVVYGLDSSNNLQFTPWPWPSQVENLEIRVKKNYVDLSSDTDTSVIPTKFHETVMIDGALWRAFQYLAVDTPAFEARANVTWQRFKLGIKRMVEQNDTDASYHMQINSRDVLALPLGPDLPFKYGI